jgi:hypothetical protein
MNGTPSIFAGTDRIVYLRATFVVIENCRSTFSAVAAAFGATEECSRSAEAAQRVGRVHGDDFTRKGKLQCNVSS